MWAMARVIERGEPEPTPYQLHRELMEHFQTRPDQDIFRQQTRQTQSPPQTKVRMAKDRVLKKYKTPAKVRQEVARLRRPELAVEALERVLRDCQERYVLEEARELAVICGRELFVGSLLRYEPYRGVLRLRGSEVETIFFPPWFPDIAADGPESAQLKQTIQERLDSELRREIDRFLVAEQRAASHDRERRGLGSNNFRAVLERVVLYTEDHIGRMSESNVRPLKVIIGATDWYRIEGFNNRLIDDRAFRLQAHEQGWTRRAPPPNTGRVPSYTACVIVVTGSDPSGLDPTPYLVLTHRLDAARVRYYPQTWSITIEENMQGPRWVRRHGTESPDRGDRSLHRCAYRGLEEELGIEAWDIDDLLLLGLFVEAPTCAMVAIFWAHLRLSWKSLRACIGRASDPEARTIAREPLTTTNLVQLFLADRYQPQRDEERDFIAPGGEEMMAGAFHPSSKARLLAYLLADTQRHPLEEVVREFQTVGLGVGNEREALSSGPGSQR